MATYLVNVIEHRHGIVRVEIDNPRTLQDVELAALEILATRSLDDTELDSVGTCHDVLGITETPESKERARYPATDR